MVFSCLTAQGLDVSNRFRSPRNPERRIRRSTSLIVLHTTEAPARSSLNKLSDRGEAHYCVTESGGIYRIVDRDRLAFHAGRSMWNGREDVDDYSIGIECVGYHNKPMSAVQLRAIRELVKELQRMYRISDDRVVCHSHVAYGMPNKWQRRRHRGRKRCGMLFAMPSVRRQLGLTLRPGGDLDTRTGRLAVGDEYLRQVLYGRIDTMAGVYRGGVAATAAPQKKESTSWFRRLFGGDDDDDPPPARKKVTTVQAPPKVKVKPAKTIVRKAPAPTKPAAATKPATAAAKVAAGAPKTLDQLKKRGYRLLGCVSQENPASKIAGGKWNATDTYYTIRNKVIPGNKINAAHIERGMGVWRK